MTTPQDDEPQTLVAACVQFDVRRGDVAGNLARAEAGIADAASWMEDDGFATVAAE